MKKMLKLKFIVDENYLIVHTLSSMRADRFSSARHRRDIVAFQNLAWKVSKDIYNHIAGRISYTPPVKMFLPSTKRLNAFVATLKSSAQFKKILRQTEDYRKFCEHQWKENYAKTAAVMRGLTGLKLNRSFTVFITHPSLKNGHYLGDNKIAWGHNEDWPNYATVYLWHEILHSYMGYSNLDHTLIQFLTDEELRAQLNGSKYPPYVGHKDLFPIMNKILPHWRRYKKRDKRDILPFSRFLKKIIKE